MLTRTTLLLLVCLLAACGHVPAAKNRDTLADNGKLIYQTGKDAAGMQIAAAKTPLRPSCTACHGANGSGGVHLPGGAVSADLRQHALTVAQKAHPYTIALLERAISTGIDNNGQVLNAVMPRWKLSQRDLQDVAQYVLMRLR
jgi:mono/diheme cytochrome c family protein